MNKIILRWMGTSAMLALSASASFAQTKSKEPSKTNKNTSSGVVVTVDPKTHHVRPSTPEEIGAMDKSAPAPKHSLRTNSPVGVRKGMKTIEHPTGAIGMTLDESYMTSMTVTRNAAGKLEYKCVEGKKDGAANVK